MCQLLDWEDGTRVPSSFAACARIADKGVSVNEVQIRWSSHQSAFEVFAIVPAQRERYTRAGVVDPGYCIGVTWHPRDGRVSLGDAIRSVGAWKPGN